VDGREGVDSRGEAGRFNAASVRLANFVKIFGKGIFLLPTQA
jgi:hypothetical protein